MAQFFFQAYCKLTRSNTVYMMFRLIPLVLLEYSNLKEPNVHIKMKTGH